MQDVILKIIVTIIVITIYAIPVVITRKTAKDPKTPKYYNNVRNGFIFLAGCTIFWLLILIYLTWPLKF